MALPQRGLSEGSSATLDSQSHRPLPRTARPRRVVLWLASALLLVAAVPLVRAAIVQGLEEQAIETKPNGTETPLQYGVPFQEIRLTVAEHTVDTRIVYAAGAHAPAVLVFHGNGEAVSDWSQVQARLFAAGITSMVFDYSGFGSSSGKPTVRRMRQDALAVYAAWVRLTPTAESRVLIGHSLGNAVMLDAARSLQPAPSGIVVHAGFTSARELAVRTGLVSSVVAMFLPDLWDNEKALAAPGPATLILHGDQDDVIPPAMGQRLALAAGSRSQFKMMQGVGHDQFYMAPQAQEWDPVVAFVNSFGSTGRMADARGR